MNTDPDIEHLLRELLPQVLGAAVRRFGDLAAAEDAVQEAMLAASTQWRQGGVPENPRGWLIHVAVRRLVDRARSESSRRVREQIVVSMVPPELQIAAALDEIEGDRHDDTLALFFMCCHPALSTSSAIALTLRAVGGLTTAEIARAFLVPEATMAQRISRAKSTVRECAVPFEIPAASEAAARLGTVMHVLYLIFNEGYAASSGRAVVRADLSTEALRLARMLHGLVPEDPEATGLLALMLLTDARRDARSGPNGEIITLDRQDRSRWDRDAIAQGVALLSSALGRGAVGVYQLQAAIAAVHDEAPSTDATDWPQILGLYALLLQIADNPMVALSHAIAIAMVHGEAAGLARLDVLAEDPRLHEHHRLDATRAHLYERLGDRERAVAGYLRAAARTTSIAERDYLLAQASRLSE
jgi:RNA polymerase sigma factor (sigma-70 family)